MTETMIEPIHPSPLEKKTNTPPRYPVLANRYASPSSAVTRVTSPRRTSALDELRQRFAVRGEALRRRGPSEAGGRGLRATVGPVDPGCHRSGRHRVIASDGNNVEVVNDHDR